jgi:hypothetical protein
MRKLSAAVIGIMLFASVIALGQINRAEAADGGAESAFVAEINTLRAAHGVGPLRVYGELVGVARSWTDHMVADGGISHNGNLAGQVSAPWVKLGENVGVGPSVDSLMKAFIASPGHYKNLVDPAFNYIGVGVTIGPDGSMYTTHDFMYLPDDAPVAAPAPEPAPEPEPAPAPVPAAPAPTRSQAPTAPAGDAGDQGAAAPAAEAAPAPAPVAPAAPVRVQAVLADLRLVDQ